MVAPLHACTKTPPAFSTSLAADLSTMPMSLLRCLRIEN
jgi:hypothetical protein